MDRRRSLSGALVLALSVASVVLVVSPSAVLAGGGSVPGGNCTIQAGNDDEPYCSYFQADVGPPGIHSGFHFICPEQSDYNDIVNAVAYVWVWNNNQSVAATATSHGSNGPGSTIWHNDVVIPTLPGYPAVLVGEGWCGYKCTTCVNPYSYTKVTPQNYFWVTPPKPTYKLNPKVLFALAWDAMYQSSRSIGDRVLGIPQLSSGGGTNDTSATTTPTPPNPTTTTTTTRPSSTTTTATTTSRRSGG
jgi:hypothetical protein